MNGLISLQVDMSEGVLALKEMMSQMAGAHFLKVSSICRRLESTGAVSLKSKIVAVVRFESSQTAQDLLEQLESFHQFGTLRQWTLLSFGEEIEFDPEYPLPHPDLIMDPTTLHCAAEIYPDFLHPVLGKTLQELVGSRYNNPRANNFEFLSRGELLLEGL